MPSDEVGLVGIAGAFVAVVYVSYTCTNPGGDGALLVAVITPVTSIISAVFAYKFGKKRAK